MKFKEYVNKKNIINEALPVPIVKIEIIGDEKNNKIVAKDYSVSKNGVVIADSKPDNFYKTYTKLYNSIMSIINKG